MKGSGVAAGAIGRLFLDQAVFAPVFIAAFFSVLCTIEVRVGWVLSGSLLWQDPQLTCSA